MHSLILLLVTTYAAFLVKAHGGYYSYESSVSTIQLSKYIGATYSFESKNYPRHRIGVRNDGTVAIVLYGIEEFRIVKALNGKSNSVSLQSVDNSNKYIRHQNFICKLHQFDNTELFRNDASFSIYEDKYYPGFISFESSNYPNYFLRHQDFILKLHKEDPFLELYRLDASFKITQLGVARIGKKYSIQSNSYLQYQIGIRGDNAAAILLNSFDVFRIVEALNGRADSVSLQSEKESNKFLRHQNFIFKLSSVDPSSDTFKDDASFIIRDNYYYPGYVSFESTNYPGLFLRQQDFTLKLHKEEPLVEIFKKDASFKLIELEIKNLVGNIPIPLIKGRIIAEIPKLDKEFFVSFDVSPNSFAAGWRSVIHFSIGSDKSSYGDRVPAVWFHGDGKGGLYISSAINGNPDRVFSTKPVELNQWTNVEISQILKSSVYVYTIRINGIIVFSEINNQAQSFDNVKVYASDPWYEVQDGNIKNLLVINGISNGAIQPVFVRGSDYINLRKEFALIRGFSLGTLNILKKEYTVSFSLKPISYSKGWKSVLHLSLGKDIGAYGDRNPGVWFHEDGSGKLAIYAAVSGNNNYYIETAPLPLGQWTHVKIHQSMYDGKYWFSVDLNGVNFNRVENTDPRDFNSMNVYASDLWYAPQDGIITDILINNGKAENLVSNIPIPLIKGKIIAEIPTLDREFLVSFDVSPNSFAAGWRSVIHFSIGSDKSSYGDRVPAVWFHADGKGGLYISSAINGNPDRVFSTNPVELNKWTNVEISQLLKNSVYVYTIRINGNIVFSEINKQAQSFDNVKVYASDPWYEVQDGTIKNLFVINGISNGGMQPIFVRGSDYINLRKEFALIRGFSLGTLNILKKEYTVAFRLKPISYSKGWKSVLHLSLGKDIGAYGDRNPGVWFHENGSGKLAIYAAVSGNNNYYIETAPLPLGQWTHVKIHQSMYDGKYWFSVDLDGVNVNRVENTDPRDFNNMNVYASDLWYAPQDGIITDISINNGKAENLVSNIPIQLIKGRILAEIPKLDREFLVSFDVSPNSFAVGWRSVIHFSIGSDKSSYGDRVPAVWFHENGKGGLYISSAINGNPDRVFSTNPVELNKWTNVEISQILKSSIYVYTIRINGDIVFSEINKQAQSFDNVKVYASDPWYEVQDGTIKNLFVINGISNGGMQPIFVRGSDYINQRKEFPLTRGFALGTLTILKKEYTVSFRLKPISYSKGWKSVLHLSLGKDIGAYGDRNPGVWFHEDGSGKLAIYSAVSGNNNYYIETAPLPLGQWTHVKIYQSMYDGKYWFSVDLDGVNIKRVENTDPRDFNSMNVYASDLWYAPQDGIITDILINNGKAENLVSNIPIQLIKGKIIAAIPKLDKEFVVSFDVNPNSFEAGWRSVIHFSIGSDKSSYGDRVPAVWFHEDGKGGLYISSAINGNPDRVFSTNPVELNRWSNVEISQILKSSVFVYTIRINGEIVFSEINKQAQSFENVKVYASDPWYKAQDGTIKNLLVINGITNGGMQPIFVHGSDYINLKKELALTRGFALGTLNVLKKEYTVSFRLKPISYSKGWKSVLHLSLGKDIGAYGDRNPGVWFHEDGSGKLAVYAAVSGNNNYYVETAPLPLGQWTHVKIYQIMSKGKYWFSVDLNGVNVHSVENTDPRDFISINVYASDLWYAPQDGIISDILINNGKAEQLVGNILTPLVKGRIVAEIPKLDHEFLVSFDVNPNSFTVGWRSVIHFSIGSDKRSYGDRVPAVWFHEDGKGGLYISSAINGNPDRVFSTNPVELNKWTNVEISQILKSSVYVYTIRINGEVAFSEINNQAQSFDNVKVYASDPWYEVQDGSIKNLFITNGLSYSAVQPISVYGSDFINIRKEFVLTRSFVLGTLNTLRKEYTVSFRLKPISYSKGWKSVLHLSLGKDSGAYGDRNPGVWFHEDGSGKLAIYAAVNGNADYYVETEPLPLGQWSHVKIYQSIYDGKYWFSVDLNGVNIKSVENKDPRDFNNINVYASDLWYAPQDGIITDILINNGKAENIVGNVLTPLMKGKSIAEIPKLDKEFLVSFDVIPYSFEAGWRSVIHFSIGSDKSSYGDRIPGVWFHEDGKGGLYISSAVNGNSDRVFSTNPIELNVWSNVEISQIFKNFVYVYTIKINGKIVFSEINNQAQSFDNVKVYASDPWYEAQDGSIKNLFVVNALSYGGMQPVVVYGSAQIGGIYSFESNNYPQHRIGVRSDSVAAIIQYGIEEFRIVKGLNGRSDSISLQSADDSNNYLRHQNFILKLHPLDTSELFKNDASFIIHGNKYYPGYISFESANYPGYFLRHQDYTVKLQKEEPFFELYRRDASFKLAQLGVLRTGKKYSIQSNNYPEYRISIKDDTAVISNNSFDDFRVVKALNGRMDSVSLQSVKESVKHLRHQNFILKLHPADLNSELYKNDASFIIRDNKYYPGFVAFESTNYPGYFLRHQNYIVKLHKEEPLVELYRKDASFKLVQVETCDKTAYT